MSRWSGRADVPRGDDYDERWRRLEASGESIHGEADLVEWLVGEVGGDAVLDAGCGTGRVAIELARRGHRTVGVDLDPGMLDTAREKAPWLEWRQADLAELDLRDRTGARRTFDVVAAPGNVMIFLQPGTETDVVARLADHLRPGGLLVAGFQLKAGRYGLDAYDRDCAAAHLDSMHRWATWDRMPYEGGDYVVSVHRRPG